MRNKDKLAHSKNKHNSLLPKMKKKNLKFPKCWKTLASERGYEKERERESVWIHLIVPQPLHKVQRSLPEDSSLHSKSN